MPTKHRRLVHEGSMMALRVTVIAVVATLVLNAVVNLWGTTSDWMLRNTPREAIFNYESISYLGVDADGALWMASVSTWKRPVDQVVWVDQLRCGDHRWIYSAQQSSDADREALDLVAAEWPYTGSWPASGAECQIRAIITAQIGEATWSQIVLSEPFIPGSGGLYNQGEN